MEGNVTLMNTKLKRNIKYILGTIIGGAAGFLVYKLIGCSTGACPLTADPFASTLYGATAGFLLSGLLY